MLRDLELPQEHNNVAQLSDAHQVSEAGRSANNAIP